MFDDRLKDGKAARTFADRKETLGLSQKEFDENADRLQDNKIPVEWPQDVQETLRPNTLDRYHAMLRADAQMLWDLFDVCPIVQDRRARGLSVDEPLGPDLPDQWANLLALPAGGLQTRRLGFWVQWGAPAPDWAGRGLVRSDGLRGHYAAGASGPIVC